MLVNGPNSIALCFQYHGTIGTKRNAPVAVKIEKNSWKRRDRRNEN